MSKNLFLRLAALFAAVFALSSFLLLPICAAKPETPEKIGAAYLFNIENEKEIFSYNKSKKMFPSASVKIMTAIVAYDALSDKMDQRVTVTREMISGVSGNHIAIEAGEKILVSDLFYALLLKGANDAAYVLANVSYGSVSAFVDKMNEYAKSIGAMDTVFLNPTGMHHPDMTTTAYDMFLISRKFYERTELLTMSGVSKHTIKPTNDCLERNIYNRNAFVTKLNSMGTKEHYYQHAKGICYGSTTEGGDSFSTVAEKDGLTYICVILGAEQSEDGEKIYAFGAAKTLLDYALDGFGYIKVLDTLKNVHDMPVSLSEETDRVMLVPSGEIKAYLPHDIDFDTDISYSYTLNSESLTAPVAEGEEAGSISVYYKDTLLGTVKLVCQNEVKRSGFLYTLDKIKTFTQSKFFICTVIFLIVFTVGFVLINSVIRAKKSKRYHYRYR